MKKTGKTPWKRRLTGALAAAAALFLCACSGINQNGTNHENANDVLLGSGKIAMLPLGSWMIAPMKIHEYISQNCAVAPLSKDAETGRRIRHLLPYKR